MNTRRHRFPKSARLLVVPLIYRDLAPIGGGHRRSCPRQPTGTEHTARIRWEITARGGRRAR